MKQGAVRADGKRGGELFWPKILLKKWLNIPANDTDFSADDDEADDGSESGYEDACEWEPPERRDQQRRFDRLVSNVSTSESTAYNLHRRRKSETLRSQYINTKELRICVGTWNVGGITPPDDLEIEDWIDAQEPADVYVLGIQEIVPLNAGNVLGAEDNRPVAAWESIIRDTLNGIKPPKAKVKCHSEPSSPSRFKPSDDAPFPSIEDELSSETDSGSDEEVHPLDDQSFDFDLEDIAEDETEVDDEGLKVPNCEDEQLPETIAPCGRMYPERRLSRLNHFSLAGLEAGLDAPESGRPPKIITLERTLSTSERVGLAWPEQPLHLLEQQAFARAQSFKKVRSFRACKSFGYVNGSEKASSLQGGLVPELNKLDSFVYRRRSAAFVRIISKQMVGVFLTIWVRRGLRKHIQNIKVSTVGVGIMGYLGNKGSISVSMSIYQTFFCLICSHLSPGEKEGDELRRNADVREILRRTQFNSVPGSALPRTIQEHEKIIWLGDLNYRINLSYEKTRELIFREEWSKLAEMDQLKGELRKGHAFDGWTEGIINFAPTYKYEFNSKKYVGDDPKAGRRTPAWCDRILSFGNGMKLLRYKRSELGLSDHRPVTAAFTVEVEVFCHRKLQKALTFTDAEIEDREIVTNVNSDNISWRTTLG